MAKKKVKFYVSPMYFVSMEMAKSYAKSIKDGYEVHFIITEADFPFINALDRAYRLGLSVMDTTINVSYLDTVDSDILLDKVLNEIARINHFEYEDTLDDISVAFAHSDLSATKVYQKGAPTYKLSFLEDFVGINDIKKDLDTIMNKLNVRFNDIFGRRFANEVTGKVKGNIMSYACVPFFTHVPEKGSPFRVALHTKDHRKSAAFPLVSDSMNSLGDVNNYLEAIVSTVDSSTVGSIFYEVLNESGSSTMVAFQELAPNTYLEELAIGRQFIAVSTGVDIVATPEGQLFEMGPMGAWIAAALDNPSEEGIV